MRRFMAAVARAAGGRGDPRSAMREEIGAE